VPGVVKDAENGDLSLKKKLMTERVTGIDRNIKDSTAETPANPLLVDERNPMSTLNNLTALDFPPKQNNFKGLPSWLRGLFKPKDTILNEWESQEYEAYILEPDSKKLIKLHLGHQHLKQGLQRALKKNRCLNWDDYTSLSMELHQKVVDVITSPKMSGTRKRTLLAAVPIKKPGTTSERLILFFSLGEEVEPIHLTDAIGRKFCFPFHMCTKWADMHKLICECFEIITDPKFDMVLKHASEGHYDIIQTLTDEVILPSPLVWKPIIKPGISLKMSMWPMPQNPLLCSPYRCVAFPPRPYLPPPRPPPPPAFPRVVMPAKEDVMSVASSSTDDDDDDELVWKIEIDAKKEEEDAKLRLRDFLEKWTNAIDTIGVLDSSDSHSDYSNSSWDSDSSNSSGGLVDD